MNMSNISLGEWPDHPFTNHVYRTSYIVLTAAILFFCCTGNLAVLSVILLHNKMRTATNLLLCNLAFADLSVGVFCVVPNLFSNLWQTWTIGRLMCKLHHFVRVCSYTSSILILTLISLERYLAIMHPIHSRLISNTRRLSVAVCLIWLFALGWSLPYAYIYDLTYASNTNNAYCISSISERTAYVMTMLTFLVLYVCPLLIMIFNYSSMARSLWIAYEPRSSEQLALRGGSVHVASISPSLIASRRKVVRLLVVLLVTFSFLWLPFHIFNLWNVWRTSGYQLQSQFKMYIPSLVVITYATNSALNPIMYALLSENFRRYACRPCRRRMVGLRRTDKNGRRQLDSTQHLNEFNSVRSETTRHAGSGNQIPLVEKFPSPRIIDITRATTSATTVDLQ